jgi:hypothetical protein
MTRDEARIILEAWRPGLADAEEARLNEALNLAQTDPELAPWLAQWKRQQTFDVAMSAHVQAISVPRQLKPALLAERKTTRVPFWRIDLLPYMQRAPMRWAAAACCLLLLIAGGWAALQEQPTFTKFRQNVVAEAWDANPHLELRSSNFSQVRQWLGQQGIRFDAALPPAVRGMKVQGCRLLHWHGHKVVMLCLSDERRHYHLFVAEGIDTPNSPAAHKPDYEDIGRWKTIAWSAGDRVFVLTGMKYSSFTKRFYRDGIWRLSI